MIAARSRRTPIAWRAANMVAMPEENVPRLPSVVSLWPSYLTFLDMAFYLLIGNAQLFSGYQ